MCVSYFVSVCFEEIKKNQLKLGGSGGRGALRGTGGGKNMVKILYERKNFSKRKIKTTTTTKYPISLSNPAEKDTELSEHQQKNLIQS